MAATGRRRAFTLVEIMVVVAILAILIAILVPSLAGARLRAKTAVCLTTLRSINTAYKIYCETENQGQMGFTDVTLPGTFWFYLAQPYLNDNKKTYLCPMAIKGAQAPQDDTEVSWGAVDANWDGYNNRGRWVKWVNIQKGRNPAFVAADNPGGLTGRRKSDNSDFDLVNGDQTAVAIGYVSSYAQNHWVDLNKPTNTTTFPNSSSIRSYSSCQRADTAFFMDGTWANTAASNSNSSLLPGYGTTNITKGIYPGIVPNPDSSGSRINGTLSKDSLARVMLNRHNRATNVAFADGSARNVKLVDLWKIAWFNGWRDAPIPQSIVAK